MEDEDGPVSPFWLRSNSSSNKSRGRSSSVFLNSTFCMILLLVIALLFMFIIIPSILKFTSQIFKPQAVKKGWDSLNIVLVLFAIFCAFLSRNNIGDTSSDEDQSNDNVVVSSPLRNQTQWYDHEYADRVVSHPLRTMPSRNSYPDLRLESTWTADGDYQFHDDTHLINRPVNHHHQRRRSDGDFTEKNVRVQNLSSKVFPTTLPARSPTPLTIVKPTSKRTHRTLPPEEKAVNTDLELKKSQVLQVASQSTIHPKSKRTSNRTSANEVNTERRVGRDLELKKSQVAPIAPPSPPPPPPPSEWSSEKKSERKRGSATKDLFTLKRKKKQRQKSVENFDCIPSNSESSLPEPPPPPPPRSTQSSSFQKLFSSKKTKPKLIYLSPPPPPPPPPPISKPKTKTTTKKSPLSEKSSRFGTIDDNTASGGESPNKIPPPPPLPPFKMPDWKFAVHGDFVRIKSIGSSGSDSPDMDDVESNQSEINGGDSPPPQVQPSMFCPSPDVDTKAGNFIARVRAGLKLEKTNSIKRIGMSKLGPEPSPSPSP